MLVAWDKLYAHPLPDGHRFPMAKYELIPEQLLHEGVIQSAQLHNPKLLSVEILSLTHKGSYVDALINGSIDNKAMRKIGFPYSKILIERERCITQGTIDCALYALQNGAALNVAGGTHHAYTDRGEGFCIFNDFAVCSNYLLTNNLAKKILIIDLDVHQGNGTAKIFQDNDAVFTFSMHGKNNYPSPKEKSSLDIELLDNTSDEVYLNNLEDALSTIFKNFDPDFVCYLSGVDVLSTDKLGKLGLTKQGCAERDNLVVETIYKKNLPLIVSMGGGYSQDIKIIVDAHCTTFKTVRQFYA